MGAFEIKTYPSKILRKQTEPVGKIGAKEKDLLKGMVSTMYQSHGIGLAAPQIGLSLRIAVVDIGQGPIKMINPKILKKSGSDCLEEGCLSMPGQTVKVKRAKKVIVKYLDEEGETKKIEAEGLLARAIQHEIDHLNGRLIVDYLNPIKRFFLKTHIK